MPVPQAAVEAANADGTNPGAWCSEAGFVSNGAYVCTSWKHNESMVYEKNPYFYDADNVKVEKLEFMLSADDTATFSAYNAGDLDFIDSIPSDEVASVINNADFHVDDQLGNYYIAFNVNDKMFDGMSAEDAATLRHALGILIDRGYIAENIGQTGQKVATAFVPDGMSVVTAESSVKMIMIIRMRILMDTTQQNMISMLQKQKRQNYWKASVTSSTMTEL